MREQLLMLLRYKRLSLQSLFFVVSCETSWEDLRGISTEAEVCIVPYRAVTEICGIQLATPRSMGGPTAPKGVSLV